MKKSACKDALLRVEGLRARIATSQDGEILKGVDLEIRPGGLTAIAHKALARKTGARGLRSILEYVLLDIMFELPTLENVSKVVVDEPTILGDGKPLLIYSDQPKVAGSH